MELKLTTRSQEALAAAVQAATSKGNPNVDPVHLLAALLAQPGGVPAGLLEAVGVQPGTVLDRAKGVVAGLPSASGSSVAAPQLSRAAQGILVAAQEEMTALGDSYVSTEHLLLALAADRGPAGDLLRGAGATADALRAALPQVRGAAKVDGPDPEGTFNALEKYGIDLTAQAREGALDPVIGRDAEIRRVVQVLSRRPRSDSGTSLATMRCARPSTTAVLPTPGSPMSTGLFLVRRDSTCTTRRISGSRPITGSSAPSRA